MMITIPAGLLFYSSMSHDTTNKQELIEQLINTKNVFLLTLAGLALFTDKRTYPILDNKKVEFGDFSVELWQVSDLLKSEDNQQTLIMELQHVAVRNLIGESWRIIEQYCDDTDQLHLLSQQDWFHFARLIRNCVANRARFDFTIDDIALLPVTWENWTIDQSLQGHTLTYRFFGVAGFWSLFTTMQDFAEDLLD